MNGAVEKDLKSGKQRRGKEEGLYTTKIDICT